MFYSCKLCTWVLCFWVIALKSLEFCIIGRFFMSNLYCSSQLIEGCVHDPMILRCITIKLQETCYFPTENKNLTCKSWNYVKKFTGCEQQEKSNVLRLKILHVMWTCALGPVFLSPIMRTVYYCNGVTSNCDINNTDVACMPSGFSDYAYCCNFSFAF